MVFRLLYLALVRVFGWLARRLRPMRGLKTDLGARVVIAGHAFVQNLRRGQYELAPRSASPTSARGRFDECAMTL